MQTNQVRGNVITNYFCGMPHLYFILTQHVTYRQFFKLLNTVKYKVSVNSTYSRF